MLPAVRKNGRRLKTVGNMAVILPRTRPRIVKTQTYVSARAFSIRAAGAL